MQTIRSRMALNYIGSWSNLAAQARANHHDTTGSWFKRGIGKHKLRRDPEEEDHGRQFQRRTCVRTILD